MRHVCRGHIGELERRCPHPEGRQQTITHGIAVLGARGSRDHASEDPVAEVGVLEGNARRAHGRGSLGQQLLERDDRQALLAVAPGVVRREAGGHREQVADGDGHGIRGQRAPAGKRRHVAGHRVVQAQAPLVAEEEERSCGERLGHRGDPKHGIRVGPALLAVSGSSRTTRMHEPPVPHHAPRGAGDPGRTHETLETGVDIGQGGVQVGHVNA